MVIHQALEEMEEMVLLHQLQEVVSLMQVAVVALQEAPHLKEVQVVVEMVDTILALLQLMEQPTLEEVEVVTEMLELKVATVEAVLLY
jgi:hypothetical protein